MSSGLVVDTIGCGKAVITSSWPYHDEYFRGDQINYGRGRDDLRAVLEELSADTLEESAEAISALRPDYTWERAAEQLLSGMSKAGI